MPNTVQTPTNPVNDAHKQYNQSRTQFPMSYLHYTTENYGLLNPFFAMEGVPGDTIPLESKHEVRAHTFKAPLMSSITKNKDYYNIPMRAILPRTWELIYANPTQGDDIPEDANCCLDIWLIFQNIAYNFGSLDSHLDKQVGAHEFGTIMRYLLFCELFLSDGCLLSKMGYRLSPLFRYETDDRKIMSFDSWLDLKLPAFLQKVNPVIEIDNEQYYLDLGENTHQRNGTRVSQSRFMELIRDYPDFTVVTAESSALVSDLFEDKSHYIVLIPGDESEKCPINIGRVLAYQLVSYHYYSNDKVDAIYSAQLYRGLMQALAGQIMNTFDPNSAASSDDINSIRKYFNYNGELLEYDLFSEAVLKGIIRSGIFNTNSSAFGFFLQDSTGIYNQSFAIVGFFRNMLGYNRSLRYGDYFTGARPFPLAVGDVNATVVSGQVNAVDMTRSLLMQRFLNAVNRVGRKFAPYVQLLSGRTPAADPTNPQFLSHDVSSVGSFEVENTGDNQGNIVTIARSTDSRYAFSYDVNEPCIVIGLSWYEVQRVYTKTIDRHAFHRTRFDMFNKFFQYQGDQAIYRKELNAGWLVSPDANFAYTLRYMEYKQRPSIATGGFVEHLPGYAFITDNQDAGFQIFDQDFNYRISPEFIRAQQAEFDRFYSSLTGISLSGYFHFIVKYTNICEPQRQMEYAPSIL